MNNLYLPEGGLISSRANRDYLSSLQGLERAMLGGRILEAYATLCDGNTNLHVDLYVIKGIIEKNECAYSKNGEPINDIAIITRVGKPICFKVIGFTKIHGETVARLSRRAAQQECIQNYLRDLIAYAFARCRHTQTQHF